MGTKRKRQAGVARLRQLRKAESPGGVTELESSAVAGLGWAWFTAQMPMTGHAYQPVTLCGDPSKVECLETAVECLDFVRYFHNGSGSQGRFVTLPSRIFKWRFAQ